MGQTSSKTEDIELDTLYEVRRELISCRREQEYILSRLQLCLAFAEVRKEESNIIKATESIEVTIGRINTLRALYASLKDANKHPCIIPAAKAACKDIKSRLVL